MSIKHHTHPDQLETYSFLWSEVRLVVAAIALFLGAYPPVLFLLGKTPLVGLVIMFLRLSWFVSGVASAYMVYRWYSNRNRLFDAKVHLDMYAFGVSVVSGLNLGLTGLLGGNLGLFLWKTFGGSYLVLIVFGLIYIASAVHLYNRWNKHHGKIF